ncbi:two-component system, OmpR family, sensor histidine kinase CpxA [Mariprofundus micogutta]|uniref:histidine kinase n=1 Tax=Mariprofundus micogutta TaxID=1921010 RepID=A0A1L8CPC9_9PROT|nr:ATP-binding protein [Mariprofundus micogutta]GAV20780.1 two-component system, OmpR family, sensor histidine kinase CpxA [Mariprofundus micogutta]
MRLYWKIFFLLMLTLLVTAGLSGWLSQKWLMENQAIEARLNTLTSMGETAVSLYADEGAIAYRQWQRHASRSQHFQAVLIDAEGRHVLNRPIRRPLQPLLEQVQREQKKITMINPPRLGVALPIMHEGQQYYWLAGTHLSPDIMKQGGRQMLLIRVAIALLVILLISWLLTRMFTQPIRQLKQSGKQLAAGDFKARAPSIVSSRKDELGDLARSFDHMAEALGSLVNSHKQLLRDISHELRSPLSRLQVALELARNEADDKASDELDRIELEAERLNELIGEVLTLARFEQGAVQAENKPLQLHDLIQTVLSDAAYEAEASDKQVSPLQIDTCIVSGDPLWIGRALDNVIRNAIRHTREHGSVEVALLCQPTEAVITVRDFGEGADESVLSDLFEPFFRASEARERHHTSSASGYGLGLAIAKRAISMHHGTIHARNHPEGGLEIQISLPKL